MWAPRPSGWDWPPEPYQLRTATFETAKILTQEIVVSASLCITAVSVQPSVHVRVCLGLAHTHTPTFVLVGSLHLEDCIPRCHIPSGVGPACYTSEVLVPTCASEPVRKCLKQNMRLVTTHPIAGLAVWG